MLRGCSESEEYKIGDANSTSNAKILTCTSSKCNSNDVEPEHCLTCDSVTEPDCKHNVTSEMHTKCDLNFKHLGCFHYKDSNVVRRGCVSNIEGTFHKWNKSHYKTCFDDDCNSKSSHLSCLTCSCENATSCSPDNAKCESKICENYTDECFVYVANNTVHRGCLSNKTLIAGVNLTTLCENDENCAKCSHQNNCNNQEIESEYCISCDSITNNDCEHKPTEEQSVKCSLALKPLGCFLNVAKGDVIRRGCVSSVSETERNMCQQGNETCMTCIGQKDCNRKETFQSCFFCKSSENDTNCVIKPNLSDTIRCDYYLDECYTLVENGVVSRGCIGDDTVIDVANCTNDFRCQRCSGIAGCNNDVIKAEMCIVCDSSDDPSCRTNSTFSTYTECPLTATPIGCYHFVDKKTAAVRRGCMSTLSETEKRNCRKNSAECKICVGEKCNSKRAFENCYSCNSLSDPNCIWNYDPIEIKVCNAYDDQCYTLIDKNLSPIVLRGCLNDADSDIATKCHSSNENCAICSSDDTSVCNGKSISQTCVVCDSNDDLRCRDRPEKLGEHLCELVNFTSLDHCYLSTEGNRIKRGCLQELPLEQRNECLINESVTCKSCIGQMCNVKLDFQSCYDCSSKDDLHCAAISEFSAVTKICSSFLDGCLTGIDATGYTHRRCSANKKLDEVAYPKGVDFCDGVDCNRNIFPRNRLQCFQCDSESDCDLNSESDYAAQIAKPCKVLSNYDKCYTFIEKGIYRNILFIFFMRFQYYLNFNFFPDNKISRGCLTDTANSRILCNESFPTCEICTRDACNNHPKLRAAKLSCFQCNDTEKCGYGQMVPMANNAVCTNDVMFSHTESCFVHKDKDNNIFRNCTLDHPNAVKDPNWCKAKANCKKCHQADCNNENVRYDRCAICQSGVNGECSTLQDKSNFIKSCNGPYPYDKRGCFTMVQSKQI